MRGSPFHVLVVAVVGILLLPKMLEAPSSTDSFTDSAVDILGVTEPIAGLMLFLIAIGAAVVIMFGSRGTGGF